MSECIFFLRRGPQHKDEGLLFLCIIYISTTILHAASYQTTSGAWLNACVCCLETPGPAGTTWRAPRVRIFNASSVHRTFVCFLPGPKTTTDRQMSFEEVKKLLRVGCTTAVAAPVRSAVVIIKSARGFMRQQIRSSTGTIIFRPQAVSERVLSCFV